MENKPKNSKTNAEMNQSFRQMTTGMQFRLRISEPQTIVHRPTNRFQTQTGLRQVAPQIHSLNNQMAFASHSYVRPHNSWIRGPLPKPTKHLRPKPLTPQESH